MEKNIIKQKITDTLEQNYMPYAMSVIVSRAIPEIDGFKPSHRKLLYTMYKMGLLKGNKIKSADVVGQTMRLNPHGDMAIYETLVRLTRGNDALLHPFIDSKGNFGKQYSRDMAFAASRYTEVKLDKICEELFKNIDKDTVDFVDNYNSTMKEPMLFPTTYPNLLVTPNQGIAVGMASTICSFNLKEVCSTTIKYIKNKNIDLTKTLLAPDFSTGGKLIYNKKDIEKIYATGRGSLKIRAKYTYDKKNNCIDIYEIPYSTTIEAIIDKIITLVKSNKIREINDIRDETDIKGLKITIDLKRGSDPEKVMAKLYQQTPLSDSFSCNFNILVNGQPKTMGIKEILEEWLIFRQNCIVRQSKFDINKKTEKLNLLDGLNKIFLDIDKAIEIIRHTENEKDVIPNLMSYFKINELQAEYIAEIKLRNLNKEYLLNRINERDNLIKELEELKDLINDVDKINNVILLELKEVSKKYGTPRRTEIIAEDEIPTFDEDNLIEDYPVTIFLTKHGYFKKISMTSLRSASTQNLKDDDEIILEKETTNKSEYLFFTDKHNVYKIKGYEIEDCKASSMGKYLYNILPIQENENILYVTHTTNFDGYMLFGFKNGKIAKIPLKSYETKMNRKKLVNAYSNKNELVFISFILHDEDIICNRSDQRTMVINTKYINEKATKNSVGLQVFTLKKGTTMNQVNFASRANSTDIELYRKDKIPNSGTLKQI